MTLIKSIMINYNYKHKNNMMILLNIIRKNKIKDRIIIIIIINIKYIKNNFQVLINSMIMNYMMIIIILNKIFKNLANSSIKLLKLKTLIIKKKKNKLEKLANKINKK